MSFILASTSPRRKELFERNYKNFIVTASPYDENLIQSNDPIELCQLKASKKGEAVFLQHHAPTLSCDTIILLNSKIYEKPKSEQEAAQFLRDFSNSKLQSLSASSIFVKNLSEKQLKGIKSILDSTPFIIHQKIVQQQDFIEIQFIGTCEIIFCNISEQDIEDYVKTPEPYDKAGGFGIQSVAAKWITGINGDYYSVVGAAYSTCCQILDKIIMQE